MHANKLMSDETIKYFEEMIYLPMLLTILERDSKLIQEQPFKFQKPYLVLIKRVADGIHSELANTHRYFREHQLQLIKEGNDGTFTSYLFIEGANEYQRRYMNHRLRNRSEELLNKYFGN